MGEPIGERPERWRSVVRLVVGLLQIMGATITLFLLVQTGVSEVTLVAGVLTCLCIATSVLLFGGHRRG